jgi:predicted RND superfamily exporter protein
VAEVLRSLEMARGIGRRQEVFSDDLERAAILVLVHSANYVDTAAIMTRVRELESTLLAPIGAVVEFGGDLGNSQAMIRAIVSTQIQSLFLTVCGLVAVVATLTGSFAMAVISLCPSFVTIIGLFGAMGILGVHLGVATSMICGISLGIGADFGVYYLFRCASIVESTTRSVATPVAVSIMGQGMSALGTSAELSLPVVTDAASIAVGFGLLGLSKVPVNATLGLTVAFTVCMCAVLTLLVIGAYVAIKTRQA